ncbi:MAG: nucleoside triphosphate pyrophosphatase [Pseudomonadota bacterium]
MPSIVLASASSARRSLLDRLGLNFAVDPANIDESRNSNETPKQLAARLALQKAQCVANRQPATSLIIGSDQVAEIDGDVLGKPGTREKAIAQLSRCSGRTVTFHTAWCVLHEDFEQRGIDVTEVDFRELTNTEIETYVDADQPFGCAGSFKAESRGIALFESIRSKDPTGLIGLPLIRVCAALRARGVTI